MEDPLNQGAWKRGWNDTKSVWKSVPFVIMDAVVGVVIGGIFEWYWGLALFVFAMICAWVGATASAPIKQRNEARYLLSEIPSKRKVIADKLAVLCLSGEEIKKRIVADDFNEDAIALIQEWAKPVMEYCYSEPDVLGASAIVSLSPKTKDWVIFGKPSNDRVYALTHLSIQLEKLLDLVMELRK